MTENIASIGVKFDGSDLERGKAALDAIAASGPKVESALKGVEGSASKTGKTLANLTQGSKVGDLGREGAAAAAGMDKLGAASSKAGAAIQAGATATKGAAASYESMKAAVASFTTAEAAHIQKLVDEHKQLGMNRAQMEAYKAAQAGMGKGAQDIAGALRAQIEAQKQVQAGMSKIGISTGQTRQALAQLPMQFSDIVVSLQGGQAPLTVFLQQGAQIKESFGGAGAALKAMGGYALGLVNPLTLAAAAAAGIALAYNQGSKEADAYQRALILTGNAAGTTAAQMQAMAMRMDAVSGTQAQAAAALATFAAGGKVAAESLEKFASAALDFERATGQAVLETAKQFADLQNAPLTATLKLNEGMNFLTESTLRQITTLEAQGRSIDAANVAQNAYADTLASRAKDVQANLGIMERGWNQVSSAAKDAWDSMLNVGRASTMQDRLGAAQQALAEFQNTAPGKRTTEMVSRVQAAGGEAGLRNQILGMQDLLATQAKSAEMEKQRGAAVRASADLAQEAIKHETDLERQRRSVLSITEKYQQAIKNDSLTAAQRNAIEADYLKIVSGITAVKEKKERAAPKPRDTTRVDAAAQMRLDIEQVRARYSEMTGIYTSSEKIMEASRRAGLIDEREYFEAKRAFLDLNTRAQTDALEAENARLNQQKLNTKDALDRDRQVLANQAKIAKLQQAQGAANVVAGIDQSAEARQRDFAATQSQEAAQRSLNDTLAQYQRALDAIGQSRSEQERAGGINQISDKYAQDARRLEDARRSAQFGGTWSTGAQKQYEDELRRIEEFKGKALASYSDYYDQLKARQGDWQLGAQSAMRNYLDDAGNLFAQTESVATSAFKGAEDALVRFATTGKANSKELFDSIIADIARTQAKAALSGIMKFIMPAVSAYAGDAMGMSIGGTYGAKTQAGLDNLIASKGWASGGYTGPGSKYQPAGIVHAGEYVINAESTQKLGLGYLDKLNGYAQGGLVTPLPRMASAGAASGAGVVVNVHNNAGAQIEQRSSKDSNGREVIDILVNQAVSAVAGQLASDSGPVGQAMRSRASMGM